MNVQFGWPVSGELLLQSMNRPKAASIQHHLPLERNHRLRLELLSEKLLSEQTVKNVTRSLIRDAYPEITSSRAA